MGSIYCFLKSRLPDGYLDMYHRKVSEDVQDDIVTRFTTPGSALKVIVCSSSFSMGESSQ